MKGKIETYKNEVHKTLKKESKYMSILITENSLTGELLIWYRNKQRSLLKTKFQLKQTIFISDGQRQN